MKAFLTSVFVLFTIVSFSQEKPCNQLPVTPDVKASFDVALKDSIENKLPERLDVKGTETASFKLQVTCEGEVKYCIYESGDMGEDYQKVVIAEASTIAWIGGKKEGKSVTSNLYIECTIDIGVVSVRVL
ncbi:MAG: hypothetical protein MK078_12235 [Crocinitomicaceae bacterium]|nr:hypothetical protein [Crocinitomicaceae bacterium]